MVFACPTLYRTVGDFVYTRDYEQGQDVSGSDIPEDEVISLAASRGESLKCAGLLRQPQR
jgi:hypothetical protein